MLKSLNKKFNNCLFKRALGLFLSATIIIYTVSVMFSVLYISAAENVQFSNAAFAETDKKDPTQEWQITKAENDVNAFNIINRNDGGFLTASSDEMLTRTATLKASKDWSLGKTSVKWKLQPVNYYRFVKEASDGTKVALTNVGDTVKNMPLDLESEAQIWKVTHVDATSNENYIQSLVDGKSLIVTQSGIIKLVDENETGDSQADKFYLFKNNKFQVAADGVTTALVRVAKSSFFFYETDTQGTLATFWDWTNDYHDYTFWQMEAVTYYRPVDVVTGLALTNDNGTVIEKAIADADSTQVWKIEEFEPWGDGTKFNRLISLEDKKQLFIDSSNGLVVQGSNSDVNAGAFYIQSNGQNVDAEPDAIVEFLRYDGPSWYIYCDNTTQVSQIMQLSAATMSLSKAQQNYYGMKTDGWSHNLTYWNIIKVEKNGANYYQFVNADTGRALINLNGTLAEAKADTDSDAQLWSITQTGWTKAYYIVSKADDKQLRLVDGNIVLGAKKTDGIEAKNANVFYLHNESANLETTSYDGLKIALANPADKYLYSTGTIISGGDTDGDNTEITAYGIKTDGWSHNLTYWNIIKVEKNGANYYQFVNADTGRALINLNGTLAEAKADTDSDAQLWSITQTGWTKAYYIVSKADDKQLRLVDGNIVLGAKKTDGIEAKNANVFYLHNEGANLETTSYDGLKIALANPADKYLYSTGTIISGGAKNEGTVTVDKNRYDDRGQDWTIEIVVGKAIFKNIGTGFYLAFSESETNNIALVSSLSNAAKFVVTDRKGNALTDISYVDENAYYRITADESFVSENNKSFSLRETADFNESALIKNIVIRSDAKEDTQKWIFSEVKIGDTSYYRLSVEEYKDWALTDKPFIGVDTKAVMILTDDTNEGQLWEVISVPEAEENTYYLKNKETGRYLNLNDKEAIGSDEPFAWIIGGELKDNLKTSIVSADNNDKLLSVLTGSTEIIDADSSKYYIESANSFPHDSIRWKMTEYTYNGETVYTLQNVNTGYFLTVKSDRSPPVFLAKECYGSVNQYFKFVANPEYPTYYEIQTLGWSDKCLVWPGDNGIPYGKTPVLGTVGSGYEWLINSGKGEPKDGEVITLYRRGYLRATGDDEDYGVIPTDDRVIYVSNDGNDSNDGFSEATPIKTIDRLNEMIEEIDLTAGNKILFRKGDTFVGEVAIEHHHGSSKAPIYVGSYGSGSKNPLIKAPTITTGVTTEEAKKQIDDFIASTGLTAVEFAKAQIDEESEYYNYTFKSPENTKTFSALKFNDCTNFVVENIDLYSDNDGETWYSHYNAQNSILWARDCYFATFRNMNIKGEVKARIKSSQADRSAMLYFDDWDGHDILHYPYLGNDYAGVQFTNSFSTDTDGYDNAIFENITVSGVTQFTVDGSNMSVRNCKVYDSPAWGISVTGNDIEVVDCVCDNTGHGYNLSGNAAYIVLNSKNVVFDNCNAYNIGGGKVTNIHGQIVTYDGVGFDFEGGTEDCTVKNSTFSNIEGSAIMIMTKVNKNFVIDNCILENYLTRGAQWYEGGINFGMPASPNFMSTGTVINTTIVKSGDAPFFSTYTDPSKDPNSVYDTVFFNSCHFIQELVDMTELEKLVKEAYSLKTDDADYNWQILKSVIDSAEIVLNNKYSTESRVAEAIKDMTVAIEEFLSTLKRDDTQKPSEDSSITTVKPTESNNSNNTNASDEFNLAYFKTLVASAKKAGNNNVVINNSVKLPVITKAMLEELKNEGMGIVLQLVDADNALLQRFTISSITSVENDLDLELLSEAVNQSAINNKLTGKSQAVAFKLAYKLPGTVQVIMLNDAGFNKNDSLMLKLYNAESDALIDCSKVSLSKDGEYISFAMDETGEYVISATESLKSNNSSKDDLKQSDNNWVIWVAIAAAAVIIAGLVICIVFIKRKKK